jgi:hypothetical protein
VTRTDPPRLDLPDPGELTREPLLDILAALGATLVATTAAIDAHHAAFNVGCWAPDAPEHIRLAAAIVASVGALRQLVAEYDAATHVRSYSEFPF